VSGQQSGILQVRQSKNLVRAGRSGPRNTARNLRFDYRGSYAWGRVARSAKMLDINAANFGVGEASVPENFVERDATSKRKIAADQILKNRAFSHLITVPQWSGDFVPPVQGKATNTFGMTRMFNEELTSTTAVPTSW
jgi:hypothetical protein